MKGVLNDGILFEILFKNINDAQSKQKQIKKEKSPDIS